MSRLNILNQDEINAFDKPPRFSQEQRQKYFEIIQSLQKLIKPLRTQTNKICMVIHWGYFRATGRFFLPRDFRQSDIDYVSKLLHLEHYLIDLEDYCQKPKISRDHERSILRVMKFETFDQNKKMLLYERIKSLAEKQMQPREMLYFLASQLHQQKIEIPGYHTFAEIITQVYNQVEDRFLQLIDTTIIEQQKINFLEMIKPENKNTNGPKIFEWKQIDQSLQVKDIRKNISTFKEIKLFFYQNLSLFQKLELSPTSCEYYAVWLKKARLSQIRQFPNQNKLYLHILAFIQHQFYLRQDVLIDILLKSVQSIHNQAIKKVMAEEQIKRKERLVLLEKLLDSQSQLEVIIAKISEIINSDLIDDSNKVQQIKSLLYQEKSKSENSKPKSEPAFKQQIEHYFREDTYYNCLEELSVQLQKRVSEIVKVVDFNESTSNPVLIEAINYYKQKDGNLSNDAPTSFLDKKELGLLYAPNKKFRISLYKTLLFFHMTNGIKSGHLNLKYSYRYKAIQDYLIDNVVWEHSCDVLLKTAGLSSFADVEELLSALKATLETKYQQVNQNIQQGKNLHIHFNDSGSFILHTPKIEKKNTEAISELLGRSGFVPIIQVLRDINTVSDFSEAFKHYSVKHHKLKPDIETIIAGIMSQGHNLGIHKISNISIGINPNTLRQVVTWVFTLKNLKLANNKIIDLINKLALSSVFKYQPDSTYTSSDGQKHPVAVDSLLANYSFKYFGKDKGVTVYTFIDDKQSLFYSTVISASEREAAYVLDGLLHNDVVKSTIHSTDMHGFTESIFAATHFIGTSFAPRFKQLSKQYIYGFSTKQTYAKRGYKILPSRTINSALIREQWDDILRFMTTIKLKEATASQLFKRLSSYVKDHPLYKAIKAFGRIIKSIFILTYIDDVTLRQCIEKQLNRIELSNKFGKAIFFNRNHEFQVATKDEQEVVTACKTLIQNAIVLWNYLYLSQLLVTVSNKQEKSSLLEIIRNGSLMSWEHVNMQGEYDFTRAANSPAFDMGKILALKLDSVAV